MSLGLHQGHSDFKTQTPPQRSALIDHPRLEISAKARKTGRAMETGSLVCPLEVPPDWWHVRGGGCPCHRGIQPLGGHPSFILPVSFSFFVVPRDRVIFGSCGPSFLSGRVVSSWGSIHHSQTSNQPASDASPIPTLTEQRKTTNGKSRVAMLG